MKHLLIALLVFSPFVNAADAKTGLGPTIWDKLEEIPATKYDIGKLRLDILTIQLKDALVGKEVPDTNYTISYFGTVALDKRLGFKMAYSADPKHVIPNDCNELLEHTKKITPVTNLVPVIWPNLEEQGLSTKTIIADFLYAVEIVNKDTNSVLATCYN
ncbi:hypothetical protein ACXJY6_17345 [Vibrio sp. RC27]